MWLLAVLAVPFVLYGADVLLQQRFVAGILDLMHPDGEVPAIETRDIAWAWVFVIIGGTTALWALKELILPRKLIEATGQHLVLRLGGPFARPANVAWDSVKDLRASRASDDGDVFPVMVAEFRPDATSHGVPANPWGARWIDPTLLAVSAREWDRPVARVVEALQAIRPTVAAPAILADVPPELEEQAAIASTQSDPDSGWREMPTSPAAGVGWMGPRTADEGNGHVAADSVDDSVKEKHWSDVGGEPAASAPSGRHRQVELPRSRFTTSHWIILEDEEDEA